MTARTARGTNADFAERESEIIAQDEHCGSIFDLVLVFQRGNGDSTQIHEGLRFDEQDLLVADCRTNCQCLAAGNIERTTYPARDLIDHHKTAVVSRPFILCARIPEADDQPHKKG